MSKINSQSQFLSEVNLFQDIAPETAASYSGGEFAQRVPSSSTAADIILHVDTGARGGRIGISGNIGDGIEHLGFSPFNFDDTVSSITVLRGEWDFFQDPKFTGDNTTALEAGKIYNLGHNNDEITSLKRVG